MTNRYDAMEPTDHRWLAQGIGVYDAGLQGAIGSDWMHPGDDAGRVAAAAYRQGGAQEAARVLRGFKRGYDAVRVQDGGTAVDDDRFIRTVGHALSIELDDDQIADIRTALEHDAARGPLARRDDFN